LKTRFAEQMNGPEWHQLTAFNCEDTTIVMLLIESRQQFAQLESRNQGLPIFFSSVMREGNHVRTNDVRRSCFDEGKKENGALITVYRLSETYAWASQHMIEESKEKALPFDR
jgi:hypothetical protein